MRRISPSWGVFVAVLAAASGAEGQAPQATPVNARLPPGVAVVKPADVVVKPGEVVLKHCLVSAVDVVQVPSQRAGVIAQLNVKEGASVAQDAVVGQIDDAEAQVQLQSATAERDAAADKASSELEVRYAVATHKVAEAEHAIALSVNEKQDGAVSTVELERLRLTAEQAALKIDVSRFEQRVRKTETGVSKSKARLAEIDVKLRQIRSPLEGEVAEIFVRQGEWVEVGKPVLQVVRLDQLQVEGFIRVRDSLPGEIIHRPVRVGVELARGVRHEFTGKITFVSPLVQAGGEYRVWAEVENRRDRGEWLLRPGLAAEMVIETGLDRQ